jgi:DMSO/TMAO reductase YedYZ molybdopterin-dependent catalytic subunit
VLAIALSTLLAWHTLARSYIIRVRPARDRRAFLRFAGLAIAGAAIWQVGRSAKAALDLRAASRRFTGSYETGSFTGIFPVVSWLFDFPAPVGDGWRLSVRGMVEKQLALSYADLLGLPAEAGQIIIDCTGGWYSEQAWRGVSLGRLLAEAGVTAGAKSFEVISVSGYARRFPIETADSFILATHVAGKALDHGHGFPVRLVAPGYRGFNWVKWVVAVEVSATNHLLQPPVPLQ